MVLISWWPVWGSGAVAYIGAVLAWGLALYVLTRGGLRTIPLLGTAAMLMLIVYLLGNALAEFAPDVSTWASWFARTWWGPGLAPALWLSLSLAFAADEGPPRQQAMVRRLFWIVLIGGVALGAFWGAVGSLTELVHRWGAATEDEPALRFSPGLVRDFPDGPLYGPYRVYALVCLLIAGGILGWLWHTSEPQTPLRARFRWLLVSAVLFIIGVAELTLVSSLSAVQDLPGHLALIAGILIMGWNMARYGALLAGEDVHADFVAFCISLVVIVAAYGALLVLFVPLDYVWLERGLLLLVVVMATHVLIDSRDDLLDRLVYGPSRSALRLQLRGLTGRLGRQADPIAAIVDVQESVRDIPVLATAEVADGGVPVDLRLQIEGALRRLNDLPALSRHALLDQLPSTARSDGTALERAALLRNELQRAIERLRPSGPRPSPGASAGPGGWLHYLVLEEAYVDGRPNKQVMQRYCLSEGTFHRARRRAIDSLARDVYERSSQPRPSLTSPQTQVTRA